MTIKKICLCLCTLVFLCACQPQANSGSSRVKPWPDGDRSSSKIADIEKRANVCRKRGGQWVRGIAGGTCAMKSKDAGKSCTSSKDCNGFCLAKGRVCAPSKPFFGCHKLYENGQTPTICVD